MDSRGVREAADCDWHENVAKTQLVSATHPRDSRPGSPGKLAGFSLQGLDPNLKANRTLADNDPFSAPGLAANFAIGTQP